MKTQFMIAAPHSGAGKTTIARGLMALFAKKGYSVQPFKCGPDYIDTKFHERVCGRPSVNLDTFMASADHVRQLYSHYAQQHEVCIVEGMMGLFDGYNRDRGSSAEIASVLGLPVVLVVDARSAAYSMAALLQGFVGFRQDVHVAGVIFNKVSSSRHYEMLQEVCRDLGIACYGRLPKQASLETESRYLGLDFSEPTESGKLVELLEEYVDWQRLALLGAGIQHITDEPLTTDSHTVLIARNSESFSFVYQEVLDRFPRKRFFNPECEVPHFEGIDLLYLPGGYPEKHLPALSKAEATRRAIKDYAERGGHIMAECGGMMYLCREIVSDEGTFPMCGVLPYVITARQQDRKLSLGYRRFVLDGQEWRGHEFHYTQFLGTVPPSAVQVFNAKGEPTSTPVIRQAGVLASYTHLYAGPAL